MVDAIGLLECEKRLCWGKGRRDGPSTTLSLPTVLSSFVLERGWWHLKRSCWAIPLAELVQSFWKLE